MHELFLLFGKCLRRAKQLQQMGFINHYHFVYFIVSPKLWSVDHQCQSSRAWVYLHCAAMKDAGQLDTVTTFISTSETSVPLCCCLPRLHPGAGRLLGCILPPVLV